MNPISHFISISIWIWVEFLFEFELNFHLNLSWISIRIYIEFEWNFFLLLPFFLAEILLLFLSKKFNSSSPQNHLKFLEINLGILTTKGKGEGKYTWQVLLIWNLGFMVEETWSNLSYDIDCCRNYLRSWSLL